MIDIKKGILRPTFVYNSDLISYVTDLLCHRYTISIFFSFQFKSCKLLDFCTGSNKIAMNLYLFPNKILHQYCAEITLLLANPPVCNSCTILALLCWPQPSFESKLLCCR